MEVYIVISKGIFLTSNCIIGVFKTYESAQKHCPMFCVIEHFFIQE